MNQNQDSGLQPKANPRAPGGAQAQVPPGGAQTQLVKIPIDGAAPQGVQPVVQGPPVGANQAPYQAALPLSGQGGALLPQGVENFDRQGAANFGGALAGAHGQQNLIQNQQFHHPIAPVIYNNHYIGDHIVLAPHQNQYK